MRFLPSTGVFTTTWLALFVGCIHEFLVALHGLNVWLMGLWLIVGAVVAEVVQKKLSGAYGREIQHNQKSTTE